MEFSGEEKGTSRGPRASLSPEFPRCFGLFILRRDVHVSPYHMVVKHSGGPRGDWSLEKLGIDSITHDSAIRWSIQTALILQYRFIPNSLDSSPLLGIQYILHLPRQYWSMLSTVSPPRIDHLGILCTIRSDQVISVAAPRIFESHGSRGGRRTGLGETGQSRQSQSARPTNPEGMDGASCQVFKTSNMPRCRRCRRIFCCAWKLPLFH